MTEEGVTGGSREQGFPDQRFIDQGRQAQVDSDWIRGQSPAFGLDTRKMVLGHALRTIVGDDANFYIFSHRLVQDPVIIQGGKISTIERLAWETELEELPQPIRDRLRLAKTAVEQVDWLKKEEFEKAKSTLMEAEREIGTEIERDDVLSSAMIYYDSKYRLIPPLSTGKVDMGQSEE